MRVFVCVGQTKLMSSDLMASLYLLSHLNICTPKTFYRAMLFSFWLSTSLRNAMQLVYALMLLHMRAMNLVTRSLSHLIHPGLLCILFCLYDTLVTIREIDLQQSWV